MAGQSGAEQDVTSTADENLNPDAAWRPVLFDRRNADDVRRLHALMESGMVRRISDTMRQQLADLDSVLRIAKTDPDADHVSTPPELPSDSDAVRDFGYWVYYPWLGALVHALPPSLFRRLRLDRNRNKITLAEQERLGRLTIGIVGLSVGNAIANTLALEGVGGTLKLADFDHLSLSNLNRLRAGIQDLGLPKTTIVARQIYELNPYARLMLWPSGLTPDTVDDFLAGSPRLDVVLEECDHLPTKILVRERARHYRVPVIMETSDRGLLDVERFDQEPGRPLLHGLLEDIDIGRLGALSQQERIDLVRNIVGRDTCSERLALSMSAIGHHLESWPQLGSDVVLGGASATTAVRRLGLGQPLPSGRSWVDLAAHIAEPKGSIPPDAWQENHLPSS